MTKLHLKLVPYILFLSLIAGCKKDRYCRCKDSVTPIGQQEYETQVYHSTKKNAEKQCQQVEDDMKNHNNPTVECEIYKPE